MKHFKLRFKYIFTPVADLNIAEVPEEDIEDIKMLFVKALYDSNIVHTAIRQEGAKLIAGTIKTSWSISE